MIKKMCTARFRFAKRHQIWNIFLPNQNRAAIAAVWEHKKGPEQAA
jgi:hypothetical protein